MLSASLPGLGRLESVELWRGTCELRKVVGAAHGRHSLLPKLYVRVLTEEGEGWGELSALAVPVGIDPSISQVTDALEDRWLPLLLQAALAREGRCPESHSIALLGGASLIDQAAGSVVEMAVLDAELRVAGRSLTAALGVEATTVPFGGLVGIPDDRSIEAVLAQAEELVIGGASRLRVKVAPDFAVEPLRALLSAHPEIPIHADANGSLDKFPELLAAIDGLGLACIEQPGGSRDLAALGVLARSLETLVCLDETISSRRVARDALRYGACRALCVKPGRVGGLRAARAIITEAAGAGASCFIGGMFETGLGRAYLGALAGLAQVDLVSDVVAPARYLVEDPCQMPGPMGDRQPLYTAPGVGPWPVRSSLKLAVELRR
jgi:O-succinylbenzoate synthase